MRRERPRDHVGRVGMRPVVCGWAEPALGVGLEDEAAKVGDRAIQGVHAILPERRHAGVQRIERVQPADAPGAAEVDRHRERDAPRPKRVGDARELRDEPVGDDERIGVDVVDRRAVDPHRREQAAVVADAASDRRGRARSRRRSNVRHSRARWSHRDCPSDSPSGAAPPAPDARSSRETSSPRAMRWSSANAPYSTPRSLRPATIICR